MKTAKILIIIITLFLSFGLAVNITALENNTSEADENGSDMNFPVMTDIPPKSEEMLAKIDPDPKPTMSFDDIPSQFSWTDYGGNWVTPVKDQAYPKYCGSCYIFGTWAAFEAAIDIASGNPETDMDLSEQYGLSCINAGCNGCGGGWGTTMLGNIQSTNPGQSGNGINGVPIESCMPYQADDSIPCSSKCEDWDYHTDPLAPDNKLWQIESWGSFSISEDSQSDWDTLKTYLLSTGPMAVTIAWTDGLQNFVENNHNPTDVYEHDDPGSTNHIILLVGWVDDPAIMGGGYWILKNSHGTQQGYGGFCNIAYGCNQLGCSECDWVIAEQWPEIYSGPGPVDVDMAVFSDFNYETEEGTKYPHIGDEIEFTDTSDGDVAVREWDFDGDGKVDSNKKRATWTYNQEGEYEVTLTVQSEWGLKSNRTKIIGVKEIWPPIADISPDGYVDNELEYTFDGRYSHDRDGGKIVSYSWDFDDGTSSDEPNPTHVFPEPDKIYNVTLTVTDDDSASSSTTCTVKIDQTVPPVTTILHGFGCEGTTWYSSTERISFSATDWSAVIDTFYRVDGGDFIRYIPEEQKFIPVGSEGLHTVECYSVDYYHNEEDVVSETFGIDKTPPSLDVSVSGEEQNGWYTSSVLISMSGDDALSGFEKIIYSLDGGAWKDYSGSFSVGEGSHYLSAVGVDIAGNTVEESLDVNVDAGSPSSNVVFVGAGSDYMFYKTVDLRIVASDLGVGVEKVLYRVDGNSFTEYDSAVTVDDVGDHEVEFYAVDKLGNEEEHQTQSFTVSPVNFEMSLDQPSDFLYLFNVELFGLGNPVIIGGVDVKVGVECFTGGVADVDYVEFLVDGESKMQDSQSPFIWRLDEQLFGSHEISVNAVSSDGEIVSESVEATCFIL